MSAAMDDFGISGVSNALQPDYTVEQIKPGTSEKINTEKISGSEQSQPEINDVFEKKSSEQRRTLEKLQDEFAALNEKQQTLEEIDNALAQTEEKKLDKEEVDKINAILNSILPEDEKPEQEEKPEKIEEPKEPVEKEKPEKQETKAVPTKEKDDSARDVNELRAKVSEKQQEIAKLQKELYHKVSSVIEIPIRKAGEDDDESLEAQAENLKLSVTDDIKGDAAKSVKMQIVHFDENLLLAMLSLRR
ncbi:MAG: hypothetical protein GX568_04450 [Candidatus Gastranaerophilales bacterium]|nr:hypothetical protein [Candidatus Gastranaerophilales bacterium]